MNRETRVVMMHWDQYLDQASEAELEPERLKETITEAIHSALDEIQDKAMGRFLFELLGDHLVDWNEISRTVLEDRQAAA